MDCISFMVERLIEYCFCDVHAMARGNTLKVVFKATHQQQGTLIPFDLNDMIAADHPVRTVNQILENIDITQLLKQYKPGGASSYHPRMLLKVMVYAYINNIYSSRKIEEAVSQNICFMWLAGLNKPDHNTINRFRGKRLQTTLQPIFTQVVLLLCEEGLLNIRDLYTDGTKIEANANRYTCVWGKTIKTNRERITQQINELWKYAQSVAASEMDDTDPSGFDKIDSEKVTKTIEAINAALKGKEVSKEVRSKLSRAKKRWPPLLDRYDKQEKIMGTNRNSISKTDTDATFMRMKEDHLNKGQLKPAYNVQISTNKQFIVCYSMHQNANDMTTLIDHLGVYKEQFKRKPGTLTTDAGYGSEENYQWLEKKQITAYVKHSQFDRMQAGKLVQPLYSRDTLQYDKDKNIYICPSGKPMQQTATETTERKSGFVQTLTNYTADSCADCSLKQACHPREGNRMIQVNHNLNRLKKKAEERLTSKKGIKRRKQRSIDTEPVFGNIKHNHHFRRFMLRSIEKVQIETGLLAIAHNLRKKMAS